MKTKSSPLANLPAFFKERLEEFKDETLLIMFENRKIAREYAKKSIQSTEPEKFNEEYIEKVADGLQVLARMALEERGILPKS